MDEATLAGIEQTWLPLCAYCDAGLATSCTCPDGDPRKPIATLAAEVRRLSAALAEQQRETEFLRGQVSILQHQALNDDARALEAYNTVSAALADLRAKVEAVEALRQLWDECESPAAESLEQALAAAPSGEPNTEENP